LIRCAHRWRPGTSHTRSSECGDSVYGTWRHDRSFERITTIRTEVPSKRRVTSNPKPAFFQVGRNAEPAELEGKKESFRDNHGPMKARRHWIILRVVLSPNNNTENAICSCSRGWWRERDSHSDISCQERSDTNALVVRS